MMVEINRAAVIGAGTMGPGIAGQLANAGIGLSISVEDMKKAGGAAFTIGMVAALVKMVLGLAAVLLIGSQWLHVTGS